MVTSRGQKVARGPFHTSTHKYQQISHGRDTTENSRNRDWALSPVPPAECLECRVFREFAAHQLLSSSAPHFQTNKCYFYQKYYGRLPARYWFHTEQCPHRLARLEQKKNGDIKVELTANIHISTSTMKIDKEDR